MCNDDWNIDHRRWTKRCLLTRGEQTFKKKLIYTRWVWTRIFWAVSWHVTNWATHAQNETKSTKLWILVEHWSWVKRSKVAIKYFIIFGIKTYINRLEWKIITLNSHFMTMCFTAGTPKTTAIINAQKESIQFFFTTCKNKFYIICCVIGKILLQKQHLK